MPAMFKLAMHVFLLIMVFQVCDSLGIHSNLYQQVEALLKFKSGIIDDHGVLANWTLDNAGLVCSSWIGITCDSHNSSIVEISLTYYALSGTIAPGSLGNLSSLQFLNLRKNWLSGEIPADFGQLHRLEVLLLDGNSRHDYRYETGFSGSIPKELGKCRALRILGLAYNQLTGEIPRELFGCTRLQEISFQSNGLSGSIPNEIGGLRHLQNISLAYNYLTGSIPKSLVNCSDLEKLSLPKNRFSGSIPDFLFGLTQLKVLSLGPFDGNVPDEIGNCTHLQDLSILLRPGSSFPETLFKLKLKNLKLLNGAIHQSALPLIANMSSLQEFSLTSCKFVDLTPLMHLSSLEYLDLEDTGLRGKIPHSLGNLTDLSYLILVDNMLHGEIPSNLPQLVYLDVYNNSLQSTIPPDLGNLTSLEGLSLGHNNFTGRILEHLGHMKSLGYLVLEDNYFQEEIPQDVMKRMTKLQVLELSNNRFQGNVGDSLTTMTDLNTLTLSRNELSGGFPQLNSSFIEVIDVSGNSLSGNLPSYIGNFQYMKILHLSNNKFSGRLESMDWLWNLHQLQVLILSNNLFEGSLPTNVSHGLQAFKATVTPKADKENTSVTPEIYFRVKGNPFTEYEVLSPATILLDFSNNQLSGELPADLGNLVGIVYLDLSRNNFTGKIPNCFAGLTNMEELDLSFNGFSGSIPMSVVALDRLGFFNVSYNQLEGEIPRSAHFDTFDYSSFIGNDGLCGAAIFKPCMQPVAGSFKHPHHSWNHISPISLAIFSWLSFCITFWITIAKTCM